MKFLFLAPSFHSNLYFPLKGLIEASHQVNLITLYRGKLEGDYDELVKPIVLGYSPIFIFLNKILNKRGRIYLKNNFELKYGFPPLLKLWREMRLQKPDAVVIKNIESTFSLVAVLFAKFLGAKVIFTLQIDKYRPKKKSFSVYLVGLIFGAKVITPLLGNPEKFRNENKNLFYFPFVTDMITEPRDYMQDGIIKILAVGKFVHRKNHLLLLRVFKNLIEKYPVYLTIVGERVDEAYVKEVENYIEKENLKNKVTIYYDMLFKQVLGEYSKHDIFVLASSDEPAAASPLGAMSRGLAVISSSANGTRCYIEENENGFVFRDKDEVDLQNKLEILLGDKEKIKKFGQRSLELSHTKYDPSYFATKLISMFSNQDLCITSSI